MKVLFVGDVMLGRHINEILRQEPPQFPWGDTLPIFKGADLRICNLECVISDSGQPWPGKVFHFRSDSKNVEVLKIAGINVISLANNHALDFEREAMFEMSRNLDKAGIRRAGAGADFSEASRPALFEIKGKKLGFISFTDNEPDWEATQHVPGVFYVPIYSEDVRAKRLFEIVSQTKKQADFLIVSAHWGPNWGYRPQPHHIPFGHDLIEAGADIVFGHSCHVFQGVEIYKARPILYSTGDFIDDYMVNEYERNDQSFIFIIEIWDNEISRLRLYPTIIRDFRVTLANQGEARKISAKMQELCAEFKTVATWKEEDRCLQILL